MNNYRENLPQLGGSLFVTDAGIETDLIFNHGIEIRAFAAHTLLDEAAGTQALIDYFQGFIDLAASRDVGLILDTVTWKAHRHWRHDLGQSMTEIRQANLRAVKLIERLRDVAANERPIVLNAPIGPCGDAYRPENIISPTVAYDYYREQMSWLVETSIDMVTGLTFTQATEAEGLVAAAREFGLPVVISFTVETDGKLPTGQTLEKAIAQVDAGIAGPPAYYMVNCAHPDHFEDALSAGAWRQRIRGIRANASRKSHAELDNSAELDAGNPCELADQYARLSRRMPWLNIFGACCGADVSHVRRIIAAVRECEKIESAGI